jgi:hypothetical protein
MLERSDPGAAFASAWMELFSKPPFTAHAPELRAVLAERLGEKVRPEETRAFREAFAGLLDAAGMRDPYDVKKAQA